MKHLIRRTTADTIERHQQDLVAVEQIINDLRAERETMLVDGEPADIAKLDLKISDYERQVAVFQQKISLLQKRLVDEDEERRKSDREKAIKTAEQILPLRLAAIHSLARWARDGIGLVEKLQAASKLPGWPEGLPRPYAEDVRDSRFLGSLARALSGLGGEWNPAHAVAMIEDAVTIEKEHSQSAMDDLRLAPVPKEGVAA